MIIFTLIFSRRISWNKVTGIDIFSMRYKVFLVIIPTRCHSLPFFWFSRLLIKNSHVISVWTRFLFSISKNSLWYWRPSSITKRCGQFGNLYLNIRFYNIQWIWLNCAKPLLFTKRALPTRMSPSRDRLIPFGCLFCIRFISIN